MSLHRETLEIATRGKGLLRVGEEIAAVVARAGVPSGMCNVFVQHTSASLIIQENADPAVLRDLERWMGGLAPESARYEHDDEGPDDMPSHLRSVLTQTSLGIPVEGGRLLLGTWQTVYLWEHRSSPHRRRLIVTVFG